MLIALFIGKHFDLKKNYILYLPETPCPLYTKYSKSYVYVRVEVYPISSFPTKFQSGPTNIRPVVLIGIPGLEADFFWKFIPFQLLPQSFNPYRQILGQKSRSKYLGRRLTYFWKFIPF